MDLKVPTPIGRTALKPRIRRAALALWIGFLLLPILPAGAKADGMIQTEGMLQAKVKVAYVFNFIKFVDWPSLESTPPHEPIRVGVIGKDPVADLLAELHGRQARGHSVIIERYSPDATTPITCHVLFICQSESKRLPHLLKQVDAGVLTVSDMAQFPLRGGVIGFVIEDGKVKIEINLRTARQSGLKISAKLLEVATVYQ